MIKSNTKAKLKKYLDIKPHHVIAKEKIVITIDTDKYGELEEELRNDKDLKKDFNVIILPGYFTLEIPDKLDSLLITLPYTVKINKLDNYIKDKNIITITYNPGDIVFFADFSTVEGNLRLLSHLINGMVKYLNDDLYQTLIEIFQQFSKMTTIPLSYVETIVSVTYIAPYNGEMVPIRLLGKEYKPEYFHWLVSSTHELGVVSGFSQGYVNEYLLRTLNKKEKPGHKKDFSPYEKSYLNKPITTKDKKWE